MTYKYFRCPACRAENRYKTHATDRVELEREAGESLPVTCTHCFERKTLHPNDIQAKPNLWMVYIATALVVALMLYLFSLGFLLISTVLLAAPAAIYAAQQKEAYAFNTYRIRRR